MSGRRGRKVHSEHVEEHPDERWMASYMDMVTVLMCMFIVLFAMSSVDTAKFEKLKASLATGFGQDETQFADVAEGVIAMPDPAAEDMGLSDLESAQMEVAELSRIRDAIHGNLAAKGRESTVEFDINERGLIVRIIGADTFFTGGSVQLQTGSVDVLSAIAPVLASIDMEVSVEGHADTRGGSGQFATDWELSGGRATQVSRFFVESGGIAASRVGATGYGSGRPLSAGDSDAERALNRRVDIVVLSDKSETVRALIPDVVSGTAVEPASEPKPKATTKKKPAETSGGH